MLNYRIIEGKSISAVLELVERSVAKGWHIVSYQPCIRPMAEGGGLSVVFFLQREECRTTKPIGFICGTSQQEPNQDNPFPDGRDAADVPGHKFTYSGRNAFLISIESQEGAKGGMSSSVTH